MNSRTTQNRHRRYILQNFSQKQKPLGRLGNRLEDNIQMNLKQDMMDGLDSSGPEYGPVVGTCKHGNGPSGSI